MTKPKKIKKLTFLEMYQRVRKKWTRDPQTQVQKNKKRKSRQQNKIDLKKEDY